MIYFDNSATTRPSDEVNDFVHEQNKILYGNPSSLHHLGVAAEKAVQQARANVASLIGARKEEILFTSGGTEADNLALIGASLRNRGRHVVTTAFEHAAVLNAARYLESQGYEVTYLVPDASGFIDPAAVGEALREETVLVSVMHVNNEIGSVQPIEAIGQVVKQRSKALFHVDAVQSFGKFDVDVDRMGIDLLSLSGHKIHAFKGIGALYIRKGVHLEPRVFGGQQENGIRPGTENMPGILSLSKAAETLRVQREDNHVRVSALRDRLIEVLRPNENIRINSDPMKGNYSPYILNLSFRGIRGEVLLHTLETKGLYVSTGSACHSKKKTVSHVLEAIGLSEEWIDGTVRLSFSKDNSPEEADEAARIVLESADYLDRIINRKGR